MTNTVPLSDEEIAHRKEAATKMLASWRAEKPVNSHRSDVKDVSIKRYEDELRYLATIDHLTKQLAEAEQRLRDNVGPRSLERIADLERQLAEQKAEMEHQHKLKMLHFRDLTDDMECLPKCDSYAHDDDCSLAYPVNAWRKLRERIADLERQLAERSIAAPLTEVVADLRGQLAERDQQLAESERKLERVHFFARSLDDQRCDPSTRMTAHAIVAEIASALTDRALTERTKG